MSYAVYVTRAPHWREGPQSPITQADWRATVEADSDLHAPDPANPDLVVWSGRSSLTRPSIDLADGNLFTTDPDPAVLRKLVELAGFLGARVQGEDGELYRVERGQLSSGDESSFAPPAVTPGPAGSPPAEDGEALDALDQALEASRLEHLIDGALRTPGGTASPFGSPPDEPAAGVPGTANASFVRPPESTLEIERMGRLGAVDLPFGVGDRVQTAWGRPATIVSIDRSADSGAGQIDLKYDDGRLASVSCVAHGLEPLRD